MRIRVEVTADDILRGRARDCKGCPVARAISRALGVAASVGSMSFFLGESPCLPLPAPVLEWVGDYDAGRPVAPLSFLLELPEAP